jgi:hypothetical protein
LVWSGYGSSSFGSAKLQASFGGDDPEAPPACITCCSTQPASPVRTAQDATTSATAAEALNAVIHAKTNSEDKKTLTKSIGRYSGSGGGDFTSMTMSCNLAGTGLLP